MQLKKISFVALNRAEGPVGECFAVVYYTTSRRPVISDPKFKNARFIKTYSVEDSVLRCLHIWGLTAPVNGGYHKVDFCINWFGRDHSYSGRFDMEYGGKDGYGNFWKSFKTRMELYALRVRPDWMKDERWEAFKDANKMFSSACEKILQECELL